MAWIQLAIMTIADQLHQWVYTRVDKATDPTTQEQLGWGSWFYFVGLFFTHELQNKTQNSMKAKGEESSGLQINSEES